MLLISLPHYLPTSTPPPFSHLPPLTLACSCLAVSSYKRISPAGPPSSLDITKLLALHNVLMIFVRSHSWCEQTKYREHRGCGKWSLNGGKRYLSSKWSIVMLFLCGGGGGGVCVLPLHLHLFQNIDVLAQRFSVITELLFFACWGQSWVR